MAPKRVTEPGICGVENASTGAAGIDAVSGAGIAASCRGSRPAVFSNSDLASSIKEKDGVIEKPAAELLPGMPGDAHSAHFEGALAGGGEMGALIPPISPLISEAACCNLASVKGSVTTGMAGGLRPETDASATSFVDGTRPPRGASGMAEAAGAGAR